jgi:hypothetical protein
VSAACSRCRKPAPIEPGADATIPPLGWIPDVDRINAMVCSSCASASEITQYMADIAMCESTLDDLAGPRS